MDFMDCHALLRKARNDNKNKDSRIVELESWLCVCFGVESLAVDLLKKLQLRLVLSLLLPLLDSKILEIESWLFKPRKEDKT